MLGPKAGSHGACGRTKALVWVWAWPDHNHCGVDGCTATCGHGRTITIVGSMGAEHSRRAVDHPKGHTTPS